MKGFSAFIKKEICELARTKKLMIILALFLFFGIFSPAMAKFTPKIMEMMTDTYSSQGIILDTEYKVTAMDAWTQFAKNMLTAVIVFIIMFSGIYTSEYTKGTLIPLLTKGLSRSTVVLSKFASMVLTWTSGLFICFGVTYGYSAYFWDNSVVKQLFFAAFCWWLFGIFLISCIVFFSSFSGSGAQVMLGTGAVYFVFTMIGMSAKLKKYLPNYLSDSLSLYSGKLEPSDYICSIIITSVLSLLLVIAALPLTYRRQL